MRSADDSEKTAKAEIRDTAIELFGEHGTASVSLRRIAEQVGVSPALILHHYGSKAGLIEAVNNHILKVFEDRVAVITEIDVADRIAAGAPAIPDTAELRQALEPILSYVKRLFMDGDQASHEMFRMWFQLALRLSKHWVDTGIANHSDNMVLRVAITQTLDIGTLLLRDHLTDVLGYDPLSPEHFETWSREVLEIYQGKLLTERLKDGDT